MVIEPSGTILVGMAKLDGIAKVEKKGDFL